MATGCVQYCHECIHKLHRGRFLVACGLISLTGVCVLRPQRFESQNHKSSTMQMPQGEVQPEQAVLRCSCVAVLRLGVKVTSSDCLGIAFCSKPGHSYRWGGRFGMCNWALYLKKKEKNRENTTPMVVKGSSALNWSRARMSPFALAHHTYETPFSFLMGMLSFFFFLLLLPLCHRFL